ncbi:MAG: NAD(P)/FAD-dependent oxidoreductase [Planctomycetota bacterium]|jgi:glycerol-3-phosphate dehydrogenase|nr:NAD(P)/FAD-dependent oxidoreductase [Planctomycetota bacterium]
MYDVLIVGCGIVGAAAAYELSRYRLEVGVLEANNDVAGGATKANNAILHAGYDSTPGTREAALTREGFRLSREQCAALDVERRELPALVVAFDEPQMRKVEQLVRQGRLNDVPGIRQLPAEEILRREPNISPRVVGGLIAPEAAIVNPWEYCIALAETAVRNGVHAHLSTEVLAIEKRRDAFRVSTSRGDFEARYIVNAAGNYSDRVHAMIGGTGFRQVYNAGQYFVFDKSQCGLVNSLIFSCSVKPGFKGTTVFPSVHGNLLAGPDFYRVAGPEELGTAAGRMEELKRAVLDMVPAVDFREIIHEFCGIRPSTDKDDFIVEESPCCPKFVNLAGMKSPGLTAAPAIAKKGVEILAGCGLKLTAKNRFVDTRRKVKFRELDNAGRRGLVRENPLHGRVICRCETITEGEIVESVHRPIVPRSIDAVKRRCNTGMGRCQGGFCGPRVHAILARELGVSPLDIPLDREGSLVLTGRTKEAGA